MTKDKKAFVIIGILCILSVCTSALWVFFYLQRTEHNCEAIATAQNTQRNLWLGIIDQFTDPLDSDLPRFIIFIEERLPEVKCVNGKLTPVGE